MPGCCEAWLCLAVASSSNWWLCRHRSRAIVVKSKEGVAQFSCATLARQSHASQQAAKPKADGYFGLLLTWKLKLGH
jgi:hypothetical protein